LQHFLFHKNSFKLTNCVIFQSVLFSNLCNFLTCTTYLKNSNSHTHIPNGQQNFKISLRKRHLCVRVKIFVREKALNRFIVHSDVRKDVRADVCVEIICVCLYKWYRRERVSRTKRMFASLFSLFISMRLRGNEYKEKNLN
jgi:hypothetical protein